MTTKKIQNTALAGTKIALRFAKDQRGRAVMVQGDDEGVFEMPEKDADFLLATKGWRSAERKARALPPVVPEDTGPAPTSLRDQVQGGPKPKLTPPAPKGAQAPPAPPATPAALEGAQGEGEGTEGEGEPDVAALIEGLRSKADAQAFAAEYRSQGYEIELDDDMLLRDMKAKLAEALLEDEDEDEDGEEG